MSGQSAAEKEVAQLIIDTLNLEELSAEDIQPEAAFFREGLGLDSIDALELSMAVSETYGFQLRSDNLDIIEIFSNLRSLTKHIEKNKK